VTVKELKTNTEKVNKGEESGMLHYAGMLHNSE
jgi:hypothetical protein